MTYKVRTAVYDADSIVESHEGLVISYTDKHIKFNTEYPLDGNTHVHFTIKGKQCKILFKDIPRYAIILDTHGYMKTGTTGLLHRVICSSVVEGDHKYLVHHVDGDKSNNIRSNLVICPDDYYHRLIHARQDIQDGGFNPDTHKQCSTCLGFKTKLEFSKDRRAWDGRTKTCKMCCSERKKNANYPSQSKEYSRNRERNRMKDPLKKLASQYTKLRWYVKERGSNDKICWL